MFKVKSPFKYVLRLKVTLASERNMKMNTFIHKYKHAHHRSCVFKYFYVFDSTKNSKFIIHEPLFCCCCLNTVYDYLDYCFAYS